MAIGRFTEWWRDWTGGGRVQRRGAAELSLPSLVPQAVGLMGLAFAGPLFDALGADVPDSAQQALRWVLLGGLLLLAHFVVVAKTADGEGGPTYRFSETDRWTSRIAAVLALILTLALSWPQPQGCILRIQVLGEPVPQHAFLQLSGDGRTDRYPLLNGGSLVEITPAQRGGWRLELFDVTGRALFGRDFGGCPDEEQEYPLADGRRLQLRAD